MTYTPPREHIDYALHRVLNASGTLRRLGVDLDRETIDEVIDGVGTFASEVLAPLNRVGDEEGCTRNADGTVTTPPGFADAFRRYTADGWSGAACSEEHGGGGLPFTVTSVIRELINSANTAWSLYPGLSLGAYNCIRANGSAEVKDTFLPKLASGELTGTMCLTEPDAGTDLGLVSTKAEPADEGWFRISGTKIFISSGEHDMAANIVHLVLARLPGAPSGTRGLSLFAVPKRVLDENGEAAGPNGVTCERIEEKMGMHGNATCELRFDGAIGQLVGEEHRGLPAMFVMMNGARVGAAVQSLGQTELARQLALDYSKERLQSRAPSSVREQSPDSGTRGPDAIIDHPDVRRMLLTQQAWTQGGRLFLYWLALQVDIAEHSQEPEETARADGLLALLTPVAKAFVSDRGVDVASTGMQVHGGAGYVREYGAEQVLRDVRILPIYEGTNGVQAHDLLGRKVIRDEGRMLATFLDVIRAHLGTIEDVPKLRRFHDPLARLTDEVEAVAAELRQVAVEDDLREGTSAKAFLELVGHLAYAHVWARAAQAAVEDGARLADPAPAAAETHSGSSASEAPAVASQHLAVARFFFDALLPATSGLLAQVRADSTAVMDPAGIGQR